MARSGDGDQNVQLGTANRLRSMLSPRDGDRDWALKSRDDFGDFLIWLNPDGKESVTLPRLHGDCSLGQILLHPGGNVASGPGNIGLRALDLGRSRGLLNNCLQLRAP